MKLLTDALAGSGFCRAVGLQLTDTDVEQSSLTILMPFSQAVERADNTGQFHGGAIAALIDTAASFAVAMLIEGPAPTINLRTDFLRPAVSVLLHATAQVRKIGSTLAVVDIEVKDAEGRLVAIGRGDFASRSSS